MTDDRQNGEGTRPLTTREERGTGRTLAGAESRGIERAPTLTSRCRVFDVRAVQATYEAFEADIERIMSTCVQSRTNASHRERGLVRKNASLRSVYDRLTPGQRARVVPNYVWGEDRVESVTFSSPDAAPTPPWRGPFSRLVPTIGPQPPVPATTPPSVQPPTPDKIKVDRSRKDLTYDPPPTKPGFPGFDEILERARKTEKELRRIGEAADADRLAKLIALVTTAAITLGGLLGAYVFAVRYLGGVAILWGWTLRRDALFNRQWARSIYVIDDLNDNFAKINAIADKHRDVLAGAGIKWPTVNPVSPDPRVIGQMDELACGPACVEMVLSPRGIKATQLQAATIARGDPGTTVAAVSREKLLEILQKFDPRGGWDGPAVGNALDRRTVSILCSSGPWVAWVKSAKALYHAIVIEGIDLQKDLLLVMDPWGFADPGAAVIGPRPAPQFGTSYAVKISEFLGRWRGDAVWSTTRTGTQ